MGLQHELDLPSKLCATDFSHLSDYIDTDFDLQIRANVAD